MILSAGGRDSYRRAASLLHGTSGSAVRCGSRRWRLWGIWGDAGAGTKRTGLDFISTYIRPMCPKCLTLIRCSCSNSCRQQFSLIIIRGLFQPFVFRWSWLDLNVTLMPTHDATDTISCKCEVSRSHELQLLWFTYTGHMISWNGSPLTSSKTFEQRVTQRRASL